MTLPIPVVDALVLAGSTNDERLRRYSESRSKAAIRLYGRLMIDYVLSALLGSKYVGSVTVAGAPDLASLSLDLRRSVKWVKSGPTLRSTLLRGLEEMGSEDRILVVACDIPLITPSVIDTFIASASSISADLVYPVVKRSAFTDLVPVVSKSTLRVKDGAFVGGNLALVSGKATFREQRLIDQISGWRKHPSTLATILGWRGLSRLMLSRMTIKEIEDIVCKKLRMTVKTLFTDEPSIGLDVDCPVDFNGVLSVLGRKIGRLDFEKRSGQ